MNYTLLNIWYVLNILQKSPLFSIVMHIFNSYFNLIVSLLSFSLAERNSTSGALIEAVFTTFF
jgi:hypothetical protein